MSNANEYLPIKDYAVIGNCHTSALVSSKGSIDWYCPGRFDAPAVFCRILDAERGGFLELTPVDECTVSREYIDSTNILESVFASNSGKLRVVHFVPFHKSTDEYTRIIIRLESLNGQIPIKIRFKPTFDYARADANIEINENGVVTEWSGQHFALISDKAQFTRQGQVIEGHLSIQNGKRYWITLLFTTDSREAKRILSERDYECLFAETVEIWRNWVQKCTYSGPYKSQVKRSALILKLLTYGPTGAIIAAPTTSLPEEVGGVRNWDYRYTWLRDSVSILYALMTIGYEQEATDFFTWLQKALRNDPAEIPQIVYTIKGERNLPEMNLDHLSGYKNSRPVRIGNAASGQFQLDIFGEILSSAHLHFSHFKQHARQTKQTEQNSVLREQWPGLSRLVKLASEKWQQPDNGIWEVRGEPKQFLYSRLMCWAALDRGIRLAEDFQLDAPKDEWAQVRSRIRESILEQGFNQKRRAFTQSFGSEALDATALIIPRTGLLPCTDERIKSTVQAIRQNLTHKGFVYRYCTEDGIPGSEATFALCTFWLVDALSLGGELDAAHQLYEKVAGSANDLGLLSEELDAATGSFLGNFPQGFTHLGVIGSAVNLAKAEKHGPEHHSETESQRAGKSRKAAEEKG